MFIDLMRDSEEEGTRLLSSAHWQDKGQWIQTKRHKTPSEQKVYEGN